MANLKVLLTYLLIFSMTVTPFPVEAQSTTASNSAEQLPPVQDTVPKDENLVSCQSISDCTAAFPGQGRGCFRMSEDDLFSSETQDSIAQSDAEDSVDDDREENGVDTGPNDERDGLKDGAACTSHTQCDSYFCDPTSRVCVEKKVCRFADMGEAPPAGVKCEEGYILNAQGVCDLSEEDKKLVYLGLLEGDVKLQGENKCSMREYRNDPATKEVRDKAIVSMKTLRAMEWLFATSSLDAGEECLKVLPYLRDEMALKYNEERKKILNNFNVEMAKIEKDAAIIENAKKGSTAMVNVHGVDIQEGELEGRKHSGYDAMMIMWRRNLLFQAYEQAMSAAVKTAGAKVGGLAEEMGYWKDKSKRWTVGGKEWTYKTAGRCRGKKAKKIKKRWANYYQVRGTTPENAAIVNRPAISEYLSLVSGDNTQGIQKLLTTGPRFTKYSRYFLVDPLMPGGKGNTPFEKFGTGKKRKRILGDSAYPELYRHFRNRIVEFYREMKGPNAPEGFVYEPEIIASEARGCIENPEGPNCELYTQFIDEMTDIAFAQFLAYSIHSRSSYKKFFPRADNMRRKLLAKLEVDFQNVTKYYDSMQQARNDQARCYETQINSIAKQFLGDTTGMNEDTTAEAQGGASGGLGAVGSLSSSGGAPVQGLNGISASGNNATGRLTPGSMRLDGSSLLLNEEVRMAFTPNLLASGNQTSGNAGGSSSAAASLGSVASQFAARLDKMKAANASAKLSGVDVASKEKNTESALASIGKAIGGSSAMNAGSASEVASLGLNGSQAASLDVIPKNLQKSVDMDLKAGIQSIPSGGSQDSYASFPAGTSGSSTAGNASKPVMSNEDIENIEANYERTKSQYNSDEADDLFSKVSKAYVRNLGRILEKRKPVE